MTGGLSIPLSIHLAFARVLAIWTPMFYDCEVATLTTKPLQLAFLYSCLPSGKSNYSEHFLMGLVCSKLTVIHVLGWVWRLNASVTVLAEAVWLGTILLQGRGYSSVQHVCGWQV